jgi:hypothetical protein
LLFGFDWLKIQGGFGTQLVIFLLGAILALDYWDAATFGQFTRRFFFLTCTKACYFVVLWLCFLGLPQKAASDLSAYYFKRSKPPVIKDFEKYLVFSNRDRFKSAHEAAYRVRALYTKALYNAKPDELSRIAGLFDKNKDTIFLPDADICSLAELIGRNKIQTSSRVLENIPIFRPVHPDWDVMLTALLMQGTITKTDLHNFIADFKSKLPKTSQGNLPGINQLKKARYVAMTTHTRVDFIPPRFELLEHLFEKNFSPVISLRLGGKNYWAALLHVDRQSGIVWFRIETSSEMKDSIQVLFDSNKSEAFKEEIISRLIVPVSLDYLRDVMDHYAGAVLVFSRPGLDTALPELFAKNDLAAMNRAVNFASDPKLSADQAFTDIQTNLPAGYAGYMRTVALIKAMLTPTAYKENLFSPQTAASAGQKGIGRLQEIDALLARIGTLRDCDRVDIAKLLVENNHVNGAPELFIRLTTEKSVSSDLIDCRDSFIIGRQLFLLGIHEQAHRYLEIAFLRHPFDTEYELWHHIAREKLNMPPVPFYSPPDHEPDLHLYYRTLADMRNGNPQRALKRLKNALEKDSHDSLAAHLMSKYFSRPLNERHFLPAPEGL